jgi:hypothetical protein
MSSLDENTPLDTSDGVIREVENEYCIFSKEGKSLGCYKTEEAACKRLRQIEFFKKNGFVKGDLVAKEASDMVRYESAKATSNEDRHTAIKKHTTGSLHQSTWPKSDEELA